MSRVDALIGSKPCIVYAGPDIYGQWIFEVEYDLPQDESETPCTVEMILSMQDVREWCRLLGI